MVGSPHELSNIKVRVLFLFSLLWCSALVLHFKNFTQSNFVGGALIGFTFGPFPAGSALFLSVYQCYFIHFCIHLTKQHILLLMHHRKWDSRFKISHSPSCCPLDHRDLGVQSPAKASCPCVTVKTVWYVFRQKAGNDCCVTPEATVCEELVTNLQNELEKFTHFPNP